MKISNNGSLIATAIGFGIFAGSYVYEGIARKSEILYNGRIGEERIVYGIHKSPILQDSSGVCIYDKNDNLILMMNDSNNNGSFADFLDTCKSYAPHTYYNCEFADKLFKELRGSIPLEEH